MTTTVPTGRPATGRPDRVAAFVFLAVFVSLMWLTEAVDWVLRGALDDDGVVPRTGDGLWGIVVHPFLHGSWAHLIGNSIPLLVVGSVIALSGVRRLLAVTALSWVLSGVVIWLIAPGNSVHIGASGVVYGYILYVIVRGLFSRRVLHLVVGVLAALYYGLGALAGLSPLQQGVSWQGHLGGATGGVLAASALKKDRQRRTGALGGPAGTATWSAGPPR